MSKRVTQQVVEIAAQGTPSARVTQQATEIAHKGTPSTRVTQQAVEIATAITTIVTSALVTQQIAEVGSKVVRPRGAVGDITLEGEISGEALHSLGFAQGDIVIDGSISDGELSFIVPATDGSAVGDIVISGEITLEIVDFIADAQGDLVIALEAIGTETSVPVTCITGDGVFVPPTTPTGVGNFTY